MVIPLAHTTAIPSQVSGSGNCPHISQPRPAALIICKYTKGASMDAGAFRYACICSKCPSAPQKPVDTSTTHCKGLKEDSTGRAAGNTNGKAAVNATLPTAPLKRSEEPTTELQSL